MRRMLAFLVLFGVVPGVAGAWDGSPRTLAAPSATPGLVRVCHDGASGAFIAWRQAGSTSVHVTRVDENGDPAAEWPAQGIALGSGATTVHSMGLVSDAAGGAYLWWVSPATLRLTRITHDGAVAPGWTAAGRAMGALSSPRHRPWVVPDGTGGLWVGLFTGMRDAFFTPSARLWHVAPDGSGAGGWPVAGRAVPLTPAGDEWIHSASFAPAEDGGAWALLATGRVDEGTMLPGEWRMTRFTPTGGIHPGTPSPGRVLGAFEADRIGASVPVAALGAISPDGEGGVFTLRASVLDGGGSWSALFQPERWLEDGSPRPDQGPASPLGWWSEPSLPPDHELGARAWRDALGVRWIGVPLLAADAPPAMGLYRLSDPSAAPEFEEAIEGPMALIRPIDAGGWLGVWVKPMGPTSHWDPGPAAAGFRTASGASWWEQTYSYTEAAYVSADAAPLPDGTVILAWSRVLDPVGVRLMRAGPGDSPLSAPASPAGPHRLALRHVAGRGVLVTVGSWGASSVQLWDVTGRRVAGLADVGPGEHALPGSASLPAGLYLGRSRGRDGLASVARVVVTR